jgi:hypothetical protein
MKKRCAPTNAKRYPRYAGRGISICAEWTDFSAFIRDMGPKPTEDHVLDRIDNDGHYEPGNCRWTDARTSTNNRSVTLRFTHDGVTLPLSVWADRMGVPYETLAERILKNGWSFHRAITAPVQKKRGPITFNGKTMMLREWADHLGVAYDTLIRAAREGRWPDAGYRPRFQKRATFRADHL